MVVNNALAFNLGINEKPFIESVNIRLKKVLEGNMIYGIDEEEGRICYFFDTTEVVLEDIIKLSKKFEHSFVFEYEIEGVEEYYTEIVRGFDLQAIQTKYKELYG